LCRAQQDAIWDKIALTNRIRALLKTFFPAALIAFERGGKHRLESSGCRVILTAASTPEEAAALTEHPVRLHRASVRKRIRDLSTRRLIVSCTIRSP
jgi:hypothetical protein